MRVIRLTPRFALSAIMIAGSSIVALGGSASAAPAPLSIATIHTYPTNVFDLSPNPNAGSYSLPNVTYNGIIEGEDHIYSFTVKNAANQFSLWFGAPNGGVLHPGVYNNAIRAPFGGSSPSFDVSGGDPGGGGTGCNTETGSFQVDDATYDGAGNLTSFAASLADECDGSFGLIIARILWNSSAYQSSPDLWGYDAVANNGSVGLLGEGGTFGAPSGPLNQPAVGMALTPEDLGYWLVASDGGIFAFGDAVFYGSTGGVRLNKPVVGIAATPDGKGYWLVASDGGIFAFGDAVFYGSTGGVRLNKPVVGIAATPDGKGYWLVASDGGIFAFGDAVFYGSTGGVRLNKPAVGIAATPDGNGHWLVASDGGIFAFGDALFYGSTGSVQLARPIVSMAATPDGGGYWLMGSDGGIFNFGDAPFDGTPGQLETSPLSWTGLTAPPF